MMSGAVMEACSRLLGLQHGNSVSRAVLLSKGEACRGVLPNEDLPYFIINFKSSYNR